MYTNMNNETLGKLTIHPLTGIQVNDGKDTVYVAFSVDISALFRPLFRICW